MVFSRNSTNNLEQYKRILSLRQGAPSINSFLAFTKNFINNNTILNAGKNDYERQQSICKLQPAADHFPKATRLIIGKKLLTRTLALVIDLVLESTT